MGFVFISARSGWLLVGNALRSLINLVPSKGPGLQRTSCGSQTCAIILNVAVVNSYNWRVGSRLRRAFGRNRSKGTTTRKYNHTWGKISRIIDQLIKPMSVIEKPKKRVLRDLYILRYNGIGVRDLLRERIRNQGRQHVHVCNCQCSALRSR